MAYIFITCLNHAAECQAHRIRGLFFKSILRQDIGWYDTHQTNDFAARMAEDLNKLQEGIGEKIGMFIFFMTIFSASLINAFYHGWELTLVSTYDLTTFFAQSYSQIILRSNVLRHHFYLPRVIILVQTGMKYSAG